MSLHRLIFLGMLLPTLGGAQQAQPTQPAHPTPTPITEAELLGGWRLTAEYAHDTAGDAMRQVKEGPRGWLALWPDHLWGYGGGLMGHRHGGARWRLLGDTLWLSNDYEPYYHPYVWPRVKALAAQGHGFGVVDTSVIGPGVHYDVPDSVFWAPTFQHENPFLWVYKITKRSKDTLSLVRIEPLSHDAEYVATSMVLTRDSLTSCVTPPFPIDRTTAAGRKRWTTWLTDQLEVHHPGGAWVAGCP